MAFQKYLLPFTIVLLNSQYHEQLCVCAARGRAEVHVESGKIDNLNEPKVEKDTGESIQIQVRDKINELRKMHDVRKLKLDKEISASAQRHADNIAAEGKVSMSCTKGNCKYGENVAMGAPGNIAIEAKESIQRWYDTGAGYDYKVGITKKSKIPGTFTQLIWKSSKYIGVGVTISKVNHHVFLVVQFSPPGNVHGQFVDNVLPPIPEAKGRSTGKVQSKANGRSATESRPNITTQQESDHIPDTTTCKPEDAYLNQVLDYMNEFRVEHHAPKLKLEKNLTEIAQAGAEKAAKDGKMSFTCEGDACAYGENQGRGKSTADMFAGIKEIVDLWYSEECSYNFKKGTQKKSGDKFPGAFTALVWRGSTMAGIGAKASESGHLYVVVTFQPPGNQAGEFTSNVFKS